MKTSSLLFLFGIGIASVAAAACSASGASGVEGGDDDSTGATDAGQRTDANYYGDQDSGGDDDEGGSSSCGATNTIENCGECGNKCPGANADGGSAAGSNVTCGSDGGTSTCGFSCSGERYDVNGDAGDGCEVADSPFGNHTTTGPTALGTYGCDDGDSAQDFGGKLPSDQRVHEIPAITGFDKTSGSAPDYFTIQADGSLFCVNNINLTMTLSGSTHGECYTLTSQTSKGTYTCTPTSGTTTCSISKGSSSYGDSDLIVVTVTKTCSAATHENASYQITGHL